LGPRRTIRDIGQSVASGVETFKVIKEFVYLGSLVTPKHDVSLEIQRRFQTANRYFFGLRKQLQSGHLSRPTKFIIYKTSLYGSETWVLTKRVENQLHAFERNMFRTICARNKKTVYTEEDAQLEREINSPFVINIVKTKRLRYAGYMIRRPEDLPQKVIFIARQQETRQ
jgi:hypothetical protein